MKKIKTLIALTFIVVLSLGCFAPLVCATDYNIPSTAGFMHVSGNGTVWYVDTTNLNPDPKTFPDPIAPDYDGDEVTKIQAWIIIPGEPNILVFDYTVGNPIAEGKHLTTNNNKVQLQFDMWILDGFTEGLEDTEFSTAVDVYVGDDIYYYSGPGFTSAFRPR
jgi:hypothetical protein